MQEGLGARVKEQRNKKGWSQTELANRAKVSQGAISQLEKGLSESTRYLSRIARALGVSTEFLTDGKQPASQQLLQFDDYVIIGGNKSGSVPEPDEYVMIPQYDVQGSCGNGAMVGDVKLSGGLVFKRDWVKSLDRKAEDLATIHAQGDSMSSTIEDGEVLLVDLSDKNPYSSKIYLVCVDGQLYIKRLINMFDKWVMRSDNPDKNRYPDIEISPENMLNIDIQGRIVWKAGML